MYSTTFKWGSLLPCTIYIKRRVGLRTHPVMILKLIFNDQFINIFVIIKQIVTGRHGFWAISLREFIKILYTGSVMKQGILKLTPPRFIWTSSKQNKTCETSSKSEKKKKIQRQWQPSPQSLISNSASEFFFLISCYWTHW